MRKAMKEALKQRQISKRIVQEYFEEYEQMTLEELFKEVSKAYPGSLKAKALHKALKKYGDGLAFFDRYPDAEFPIMIVLGVVIALLIVLVKLLLF